ncbi:MAG: cytochrome c peroxidase, partial [Granulosicoccus sp.]
HTNLHEHLKNVDGNPKQFNFTHEEKEALISFLKTMTDETFLTDPKFSDPFK